MIRRLLRLVGPLTVVFWIGMAHSDANAEKLVLFAGGARDAVGVPASEARLNTPFGIDLHPRGDLLIVEYKGGRVLQIDRQGMLTLAAGCGRTGFSGDGGPPQSAEFNAMHSLAVAPTGLAYLADTLNHRVRVLDIERGRLSTFAGSGRPGFSGDGGQASDAQFKGIYCVAIDPPGQRLFLADLENKRIRAIDLRTGIVSTVAGNGKVGVPTDGAKATEAPLVDPRAVTVDRSGNIYILERGGNALRVVDATGRIRTVAGTGKPGRSVPRAAALQATFDGPKHLCIDRENNVIIADTENHVVRKYSPADQQVVQIAGTGIRGSAGLGGAPLSAQLSQPHGVLVDPQGSLFIVDSMNHRVLKISP
jgi:DNA-binding beta-propeller fold protein YncE